MAFIVAIDGPAGSGKGTIAKKIASKINAINIDTGAMFRCVALKALREKVSIEDKDRIREILNKIDIKLEPDGKVFLDAEDVTTKIRTEEVSRYSSPISTIQEVREKLLVLQRNMASSQDVVMEGRDIGTVVFPNANVKIYLDASPEERAKRRIIQNQEKGIVSNYEEVLEEIKNRDYRDMTREIAPLKKAEDAIYIDSTNLSINQVETKILDIIEKSRM